MRLYPNNYFGWPAQSFGFAYGCIAAVFVEPLQRFFVKRIKEICVVCILVLPVLGIIYLRIHTPERESVEMYFIRVAMSLLMVLLFLTLSVRMSIVNRLMTYLGKISLYIYLLHGMMIDLFNGYLTDGWYILACIITTVLAAACFSLVTEKVLALFRYAEGIKPPNRI